MVSWLFEKHDKTYQDMVSFSRFITKLEDVTLRVDTQVTLVIRRRNHIQSGYDLIKGNNKILHDQLVLGTTYTFGDRVIEI